MKKNILKNLIDLCEREKCSIQLEVSATGAVARVSAVRGKIFVETSIWLDRNDGAIDLKLIGAARSIAPNTKL